MDNNQNENQSFQNGMQEMTHRGGRTPTMAVIRMVAIRMAAIRMAAIKITATRTMDIMASHSIIIREIIRREEDIPLRV